MARSLQFKNTTNLAISGTYTSDASDGFPARRLVGYVYASHAGNLYFEHSVDGTTWRRSAATAVAATTLVGYDQVIFARYIRVVYINGATATTTFDICGYLYEN